MTKLYLALSGIFWFIRQFFMPNPFEVLGEGIAITVLGSSLVLTPEILNWIAGLFLPSITFVIVGLYYSRGSCPVWGSLLYMFFFCLHTFILYLMSWAYPYILIIVLIAVVYIALHVGIGILRSNINSW